MREIKFRAWHKVNNDFITDWDDGSSSLVEFHNNGKFIVIEKSLTCHCSPEGCGGCADGFIEHSNDDVELMQSTGMKDKNGVEIFEGDVFYIAGTGNCTVGICPCYGTIFTGIDRQDMPYIDCAAEQDIGDRLGNIHENPELLNNGEIE